MGVTRGECLYDDEIISIASVYTVIDGKQINIPEQLHKMRNLSRGKKLFCPCGCGRNLVLVANEQSSRAQHFRLWPSAINDDSLCTYQEESGLTLHAKVMLKCWLEQSLKATSLKYNVPISEVSAENERRYQMSVYSTEHDIGIVYYKYTSNIEEEKVSLLSDYAESKIFFVSRIENEEHNGQYPEKFKPIQDRQGFCMFLKMDEESDYNEVEVKISYYTQNHRGWWECLSVAYGMIDQFSITSEGEIIYEDIPVLQMVKQAIDNFRQQEQRQEQDRQLRIQREQEKKKRIEEEKIRIEEEKQKQKQRQLEQEKIKKELDEMLKKTLKRQELENFLKSNPKTNTIYQLLKNCEKISGKFYSDISSNNRKQFNVSMNIVDVKINLGAGRLEISESPFNKAYFYIIENDMQNKNNRPGTGVSYQVLDYINVPEEKVISEFMEQFNMVRKGMPL